MSKPLKILDLNFERAKKARWPVDRIQERMDEFEEVLILAKVKGEERYIRFSSSYRSTFWWIGVLEAMKYNLLEESVTCQEE
jgi:hypothetical protein